MKYRPQLHIVLSQIVLSKFSSPIHLSPATYLTVLILFLLIWRVFLLLQCLCFNPLLDYHNQLSNEPLSWQLSDSQHNFISVWKLSGSFKKTRSSGHYAPLLIALAEGLETLRALLGAFGPLLSSTIQKYNLRRLFGHLILQNPLRFFLSHFI